MNTPFNAGQKADFSTFSKLISLCLAENDSVICTRERLDINDVITSTLSKVPGGESGANFEMQIIHVTREKYSKR